MTQGFEMQKRFVAITALALFSAVFVAPGCGPKETEKKRIVLCTTFPIYQLTRNVVGERDGVEVKLLLPSQLGCPHDYALTPQDMQKLANAEVLVVNGLGMEEFLGAPVRKANDKLTIIDSSAGINDTLEFTNDGKRQREHEFEEDAHSFQTAAGDDVEPIARKPEGGHHHHHHGGVNPHPFVSPRMAAMLVNNIAAELAKADSDGAEIYSQNAQKYAATLNALADEMAALGKKLKNNRIVQPHGIFDYLARDMGLEIIAVMQAHGQEPSAAEMLKLVATIKEKKVGAIFFEPQYPEKVGKTLSLETGVPAAMLDPAASGPENAPFDYYETVMRKNMKTLEATLETK
jgi:zinc transport system substrate-binding protein